MSKKLKGVAAAPGVAIAPMVHFHSDLDFIPTRSIAAEQVDAEKLRLEQAIRTVARSILGLRQELTGTLSDHDTKIYDAQLAIVHDSTFRADMEREIDKDLTNSEVALQRVIHRYEVVFEKMEDAAMRERAADLRDVGRQVLGALMAKDRTSYTSDGQDYIFAADEFLPSDAGLLDRDHIRGIVTARGGKYSHGAILARSLGIPSVVAVDGLMQKTASGDQIILDGDNGRVLLEPSDEDRAVYEQRNKERESVDRRVFEVRFAPSVTTDGEPVKLMANMETVRDLESVEQDVAEGIGLFRTEFAFMERSQFPTEDEQVEMYGRALSAAGDRVVTFRTLDVGGDKPLNYFRTPEERNPVLGWRGLRISLSWPDILYTQLRAILRAGANHPKVRILLPMVGSRDQVIRAQEALRHITADLEKAGEPHCRGAELGVMVEVPAIVHILPELSQLVDFISVGTNDLVQYLLAVDRDNPRVAALYDPYHPAVMRVLEMIGSLVRKTGISASICGEVAGDHHFTPLLIGFGFRELSMAPVFLPRVKLMVRSFSIPECTAIAKQALAMDDAASVRRLVRGQIRVRWARFLEESPPTGTVSI